MGSIEKPELTIAPQVLPKVANPAPLGLAGFGLTTVVLSCINAGLLPATATTAVVPLAFAFGGVAQIIAGILEFANGNTFGTVAFTSYGLFWWWYAFLVWTIGAGWIKPPAASGVATALLMWGIFTFYMWIATFRSNKGVWSVFLLLWITFILLAAGDFGWAAGKTIGGWVGIATGADALYVSFAEVTNGAFGREVIPLGKPISSAAA
ncbi:MAG TPA: acetate uptake transporter [Candidatus Binatia bacterium]|nr:acetate uptake transporter [Candidatus Binatia bacterium]